MSMQQNFFKRLVDEYEKPERQALSRRYPVFLPLIMLIRRSITRLKNILYYQIARKKSGELFNNVVARHQSALFRKLGDSDMHLQVQKIKNLKRACEDLNGLIIKSGEVFSLWESIGMPTASKGYVKGMFLSEGKVIEGIGGGLCQLSNFFCWIFLHADTEIVERTHHSMDVFPDSGRVLPFGSGATCLYNFVDLKVKNVGKSPIQLFLGVTKTHLKGQIRSKEKNTVKFSLQEMNHVFIRKDGKYYRYNEIWRIRKKEGKEISRKKEFTNFAPVIYAIDKRALLGLGYNVIDFDVARGVAF